jgi:hypothetical protein
MDDPVRREMLDVLAWSRVADLRDDAEELARLVRSCQPGPHVAEGLASDPQESRLQLLLMYLSKRGQMRRVIELLAG